MTLMNIFYSMIFQQFTNDEDLLADPDFEDFRQATINYARHLTEEQNPNRRWDENATQVLDELDQYLQKPPLFVEYAFLVNFSENRTFIFLDKTLGIS